jgi:two-component system response regulator YesN
MCFVTPAYFRRLFREYSGMSPSEYRTFRRIERAKDVMERAELSVEALSELLGYSDPSYFCRVFKKETGMSPSEYQKKLIKQ